MTPPSSNAPSDSRRPRTPREKLTLLIAQGFGTGLIPLAPGTFGSGLGCVWFAAILLPNNWAIFFTAILASIIVSIITADDGEKILGQSDPNSIVIDEIIAIPICFLGWLYHLGDLPGPLYFLQDGHWKTTLILMFFWRLFDVWKPWPVRDSQKLPGGYGVTIDDILAALYVALLSGIWFAISAP
jgi:phosphatidylglycerophosphatase A